MLQQVQSVRDVSCINLALMNFRIVNWVNALSGVTRNSNELTINAVNIGINVVSSVLQSIRDKGISLAELETNSEILKSVDNILGGLEQHSNDQRRILSAESPLLRSITTTLDNYGQLVAQNMIVGQGYVKSINGLFRTSSQVFTSKALQLSAPQTDEELSVGVVASTVSIDYENQHVYGDNFATQVVTTSMKSKLYNSDLLNYNSNPLRVHLAVSSSSDLESILQDNGFVVFTFVIQNNGEVNYPRFENNVSFQTKCVDDGEIKHFNYSCPNTNFAVTHICNGTKKISLSSTCPKSYYSARCDVIDGPKGIIVCNASTYDEFSTTCTCRVPTNVYFSQKRR
jgi:hypothetical protein